jgi:release factor glutamine methyltransferase
MATIRQLLQQAKELHIDTLDAEVLLAHFLKENRAYLFTWPEKEVAPTIIHDYQQGLSRRQQGEPIAYIIGYKEFWSMPIQVTVDTLIPRADTECWLEWILQTFAENKSLQVLELGAGSGAVAIVLAKERPNWAISAVDISLAALTVARENEKMLLSCQRIEWLQGDWYQAIVKRQFDIIVANPPYIAETEPHWQQGDLRFEPKTALVAADEGLADLRYIITQAPHYLSSEGVLLVEHGYTQGQTVQHYFVTSGFKNIITHEDYGGRPRWTTGWMTK